MLNSQRLAKTPIPDRMKSLPLDGRGYPIPAIVYRDKEGKPHFTVNDELARQQMIAQDKCPICAQSLLRGRWFVGGPRSAFDPKGVYNDTAMHYECMEYAMKVCPYLAVSSYTKRIDAKTVPADEKLIHIDPTTDPNKPAVFVAVMATKTDYTVHPIYGHVLYVKPRGPYKIVEFWRDGVRLPSDMGMGIVTQFVSPANVAKCIDKKTLLRWGG